MDFSPWVLGWIVLGLGLWIQRHWHQRDLQRSLRMVALAWALQWMGVATLARSNPGLANVSLGVGFLWFAISVLMPLEV